MRIGLAVALLAVILAGCTDPAKTISAVGYRNAVSLGAQQELAQRGVPLRDRPDCRSAGVETAVVGSTFTVDCTASAHDGSVVAVHGTVTAAGTPGQHEEYLIRSNGRTVLRSTCLGIGCR